MAPSFYTPNSQTWENNTYFIPYEWYLIAGLSNESIYDRVAQWRNHLTATNARMGSDVDISLAYIILSDIDLEYIYMTQRTGASTLDASGVRRLDETAAEPFTDYVKNKNSTTDTDREILMLQNVEQIKLSTSERHKLHTPNSVGSHNVNTGKELFFTDQDNYANWPPKWNYEPTKLDSAYFKTINWGKIHPALFDNDLKHSVGIWIYTIPKMTNIPDQTQGSADAELSAQLVAYATSALAANSYSGSTAEMAEGRADGIRSGQTTGAWPPPDSEIDNPIFPAECKRGEAPSDNTHGPFDYNSSNNIAGATPGTSRMNDGVKQYVSGAWIPA